MSPKKKKQAVRITNPTAGCGWTSLRNALRYIQRGLARWTKDGAIEFVASDPRVMTVRVSYETEYDRAAHAGLADMDAIRNVPVVGRPELLLTERSRRRAA